MFTEAAAGLPFAAATAIVPLFKDQRETSLRHDSKLTSVAIILVVAIAMHRVGAYASGLLLDFVNASG